MNRKKLCLLFLLLAGLTGCAAKKEDYLILQNPAKETESEALPVLSEETQENEDRGDGGTIMVYLCGEVIHPGVYELTVGSRVYDAVEMAGGMTEHASREYWNLAEVLTDGQMMYFPTAKEAGERMQAVENHQRSSKAEDAGGKVRINVADQTELESIPGVGATRAEAILKYRQEHGDFKSAEDIMQVSGIGEALFDKMRDYITVD